MKEALAERPLDIGQFDHEWFDRHKRAYNDATTWLAETLDGSMRTPFEYTFDGRELYADDDSALGKIFDDALRDAYRLAGQNPALAFEIRRRTHEREEYRDMLAMMRGEGPNTMVVLSDFPAELSGRTQDVGGYNARRRQAMLRVLTRQGDRLHMQTQSLDGSNRPALEAIYGYFGRKPAASELLGQRIQVELPAAEQPYVTSRLMGVYDRSLETQFGGQWNAGRQELIHDTYHFVRRQHDLIDKFVQCTLQGGINKTDLYNIAALMAKRFEAHKHPQTEFTHEQVAYGAIVHDLEWQLQIAGEEARAAGRTFSGCGASAGGGSLTAAEQLNQAGYGDIFGKDEDQFGPLTFKCKNGHTNRRPRGKLISECHVLSCKNSVAC